MHDFFFFVWVSLFHKSCRSTAQPWRRAWLTQVLKFSHALLQVQAFLVPKVAPLAPVSVHLHRLQVAQPTVQRVEVHVIALVPPPVGFFHPKRCFDASPSFVEKSSFQYQSHHSVKVLLAVTWSPQVQPQVQPPPTLHHVWRQPYAPPAIRQLPPNNPVHHKPPFLPPVGGPPRRFPLTSPPEMPNFMGRTLEEPVLSAPKSLAATTKSR